MTSVREQALTLAPTVGTSSLHDRREPTMVTFHGDDADDGLGNHTPPPVNQDPPPPALQAASQGNETPCPDPPASGGPGANGPDEGVWVPPAETEAYLAWKRERRGKAPVRDLSVGSCVSKDLTAYV